MLITVIMIIMLTSSTRHAEMINVSHPLDPLQMDGNHSFPKWMGMAHCHIGNQGVGGSIKVTICLPDPPENGD